VNDLYKENYKEKRNQRRLLQKLEWSPMLMAWQNQHSNNGCTTKSNLHVQCNSHQNPNDIHHRDWKVNTVHLETQKTTNSCGNIEQKAQCWRYHNAQLQTTLQSHSKKTSWYWHKNTYNVQWNRIDMNQHSYDHLIFDKVDNIQWRKDSLFNNWCWEN
jgi:hypothetical protein